MIYISSGIYTEGKLQCVSQKSQISKDSVVMTESGKGEWTVMGTGYVTDE